MYSSIDDEFKPIVLAKDSYERTQQTCLLPHRHGLESNYTSSSHLVENFPK